MLSAAFPSGRHFGPIQDAGAGNLSRYLELPAFRLLVDQHIDQ